MKIFQSISSVVLAVIVLLSSTGVVLNKHYCGGELKSISLHKEHNNCAMMEVEETPSCHRAATNNSCCENEQIHFKTDEFKAAVKITIASPLLSYIFEIHESPGNLAYTNLFDKEYSWFKPPSIPPEDITIKIQSLLI